MTGGKGADIVSFDVYSGTIGGKGAKLTLGDGANTALLNGRNGLGIYGNLTTTSGVGDTTVTVGGGLFQVRGGLSATFGDGKGKLDLQAGRAEIEKGLTFSAKGAGDDTLNFNGSNLEVKGNLTATGDAGALSVTATVASYFDLGNVSITTKAGGGTTNFFGGGDINGKFTYNGGTGANNLFIGRPTYPVVYLHDALTFTSKAATGAETLQLQHVLALGAVSTKLGAAANTVTIDDIAFLNAVSLDTGGGNDTINFSRTSGLGGIVSVYGPLKILTGAGDDTVNLGDPANINVFVPVASTLIDGGDGTDTVYNNRVFDGVTFFTPTEKNFETVAP